jgi:hypothetical protein
VTKFSSSLTDEIGEVKTRRSNQGTQTEGYGKPGTIDLLFKASNLVGKSKRLLDGKELN